MVPTSTCKTSKYPFFLSSNIGTHPPFLPFFFLSSFLFFLPSFPLSLSSLLASWIPPLCRSYFPFLGNTMESQLCCTIYTSKSWFCCSFLFYFLTTQRNYSFIVLQFWYTTKSRFYYITKKLQHNGIVGQIMQQTWSFIYLFVYFGLLSVKMVTLVPYVFKNDSL